jgi:hypothetical protein
MKRLITICAVVGCILAATGIATADDVLGPPEWWEENPGIAASHWDDWTGFPGPMAPDYWDSTPELTTSPYAYAYGSAYLESSWEGRSNLLRLMGDDELKFHMPNFVGGDYKDIWIQVTYYKPDTREPSFNVNAEGLEYMTEPVFEGFVEHEDGWVTDAWSFQIWPNPPEEEIWLNFSSYSGFTYVDQVVIDTRCVVPEPATICLLGLGALSLLRRKSKLFKNNQTLTIF